MDTMRLQLDGMTCATCATRIEKVLRRQDGVTTAQVNYASEVATIALDEGISADSLIEAVRNAGYDASLAPTDAEERAARVAQQRGIERRRLLLVLGSAALTIPLVLPMVLAPFGVTLHVPGWLQLVLATPVQFVAGARFYRGALGALRARSANMDLLVALGTSAAWGLSVVLLATGAQHLYFEGGAAVITLVLFGKWMEARAKQQAGRAIEALIDLRPETARVLRGGIPIEGVPVAAVGAGEIVVVRPGERVPVDGVVRRGSSTLDESLLTGESRPAERGEGDAVIGGSINGAGLLHVEATAVGEESALARIIHLVEEAQASRAPIQATVDRISAVFVPVVLVIAALALVGWLLAGATLAEAMIIAVSVLVIACPCALGLATPAALMAGTGVAAKAGILIEDAEALERARSVDVVIFDKTGTLTEGRPEVAAVLADEPELLLALVAAAESGSEHPLAEAIVREATARTLELPGLQDFEALPGRGLRARVDGRELHIGSRRLMEERGIDRARWEERAQAEETAGRTVMWVAEGDRLLGAIAVGDRVRDGAREAIAGLKARGIEAVMLTGDNERTAGHVAAELGIDRVIAQVLPAEKADVVQRLRAEGKVVAMVGDGVNDAPALAAADVGFAMGTGTDVALRTAGVTLMRSHPSMVADAIDISRATTRKIHQNLFWAFIYNVIGLPLAAAGLLTPMFAGGAMALSSVSVLGNALLLQRWKGSR